MTVQELAEKVGGKIIVNTDADVAQYYAGDFLSRVMGNAPSGCAWFTVMANLNVAGVAGLAQIAVIVLCEGVEPADGLVDRCKEEGIALITTDRPLFDSCVSVV